MQARNSKGKFAKVNGQSARKPTPAKSTQAPKKAKGR